MRTIRVVWLPLLLVAVAGIAQQHPNVERGFLPDKSYQLGDVDVINLFNGTPNISIPVGSRYPVNGNLSYQFQLSYAANPWGIGEYHETVSDPLHEPYVFHFSYQYSYPQNGTNAGFGWLFTFGALGAYSNGQFAYLSPDGGRHAFYDTLHANSPSENSSVGTVAYTRDGTYLRLKINASTYELEFPNGDKHTFERVGAVAGRLTTMSDAFGNTVTISYGTRGSGTFSSSSKWTVTDTTGRQHYVYFRPAPGYAEENWFQTEQHEVVDYFDLAGFNESRAEYHLEYASDGAVGQPPSLLLPRRCTHAEPPPAELSQAVRVAVLDAIQMPIGRYEMEYDLDSNTPNGCSEINFDGTGSASGNITSLRLPTGATIHYEYGAYYYPGSSSWNPPALGGDPGGSIYFSLVPGVKSRVVKDRDGSTTLSETEYVPEDYLGTFPQIGQRRIVKRKNDGIVVSEERHYFSTCVNIGCGSQREYGLPLTRTHTDPASGAFLSTETVTPAGIRSSYVKYEGDGDLNDVAYNDTDLNRRVRYSKTVFEDGRFSEVTYSKFDGLGHFRQAVSNDDITGSQHARTTLTNLNPLRGEFNVSGSGWSGGFTMPPVASKWVLHTFDVEQATEDGVTSTSRACFDGDGFMTSRRTYSAFGSAPTAAANDLLAIFHPDDDGNVEVEQYLGGDTQLAPDGTAGVAAPLTWNCGDSSATDTYRIAHKYDEGVRKASYFVGSNGLPLSFFITDTDIDPNTGLPKSRREASTPSSVGVSLGDGLRTDLTYDALGRPVLETPVGGNRGAQKRIVYAPDLATVQIFEETAGDGTLRERSFELDGLGRVVKETRSMPNGASASREWNHDDLGRLTAASSWGNGAPLFTRFQYDALGRLTEQRNPDDVLATFTYTGISSSTATRQVRTSGTADTLTQSAATTTMTFDGQGRIRRVTEPTGIITRYAYDIAGRLKEVCGNETVGSGACVQTRTFTYDNRGFLTAETMPELGAAGNGTTSYKYDAKGNVRRRTTGASGGDFDVWMGYDRAGRLERVYEAKTTGGVNRNLKLFTYASSNSGTNYRNGRMTSATRYNWFSDFGVLWQIVEDYTYAERDGRVSKRETHDRECTNTPLVCNSPTAGIVKRSFETSQSYDALGAVTTLQHPKCLHQDCYGVIPDRTVTNTYDKGWLESITWISAPQPSSISYHPNGMVSEVIHGNQVKDTTALNPTVPMPRPYELKTTNVTDIAACIAPAFTTQPASDTVTSQAPTKTMTATATGQTGLQVQYQWFMGSSGDRSNSLGPPSSSAAKTVTPAVTTRYWVEASTPASGSCLSAATPSETATLTVCTPPQFATGGLPESANKTRGQTATLSVVVSAGSTPEYQWFTVSGQTATQIEGATTSTIQVTPQSTTHYRVTAKNSCGEVSATATITIHEQPTAPLSVTASSNGSGNTISWTASTSTLGLARYEVQRIGGPTFTHTNLSNRTLIDASVSQTIPPTAYRYRVRAVDTNGVASAWSEEDYTVTMAFTDDPLQSGPQGTPIRGVHISELRQAIDALRVAAGLMRVWISYDPQTGYFLSRHIREMRQHLNEARAVLDLPPVQVDDVLLTAADPVREVEIRELRSGVR